jgi:asparagine synthetase A
MDVSKECVSLLESDEDEHLKYRQATVNKFFSQFDLERIEIKRLFDSESFTPQVLSSIVAQFLHV